MISFQILQMDPDAAKWLGFAKQQCNRIMDNGTKDFYREWPLGDAVVKAKSYGGTVKLWLVAGGVTDFVGVAMPNPVPYRGVSIGQTVGSMSLNDYIIASDSDILLQDVTTYAFSGYGSETNVPLSVLLTSDLQVPVWNAAGIEYFVNFVNDGLGSPLFAGVNKQTVYSVPEDCIYPLMVNIDWGYGSESAYAALIPNLTTDWQAGIDALNTRRKAWFLKNSDEFMAALKGKFQPGAAGVTRPELQTGSIPASWDYQIKSQYGKDYTPFTLADGSVAGRHTKMSIILTVTYVDTVQSDTSAGLTQAGTKVTQRAATFVYVDVNGVNQTTVVNGTLTQAVTQHMVNGHSGGVSQAYTYLNWYSEDVPFGTTEVLLAHQFLRDRATTSDAALWNGVVRTGNNTTSALGIPDDAMMYFGYVPPWPPSLNTLVGTAAPLYLQYHNEVPPVYVANTAQSSTVMNNSALYHVKQIKLKLFGPAPGGQAIGIFPTSTDADGATQIAYYGEATLSFDWAIGSIVMSKWSPKRDVNGDDAPAIIALPTGYSYFVYNVRYLYDSNRTYGYYDGFELSVFVKNVKSTIAGVGQTPSEAASAAYTAIYNGLTRYTVSARVAAATSIRDAISKMAPTTGVLPLASASNITAMLPDAVTAAVAAAMVTNPPPAQQWDMTTLRYYILNSIQNLTPTYNCVIGYTGAMWPDVAEYWKVKNSLLKAGTFDQVLYTVMQGKQITIPP